MQKKLVVWVFLLFIGLFLLPTQSMANLFEPNNKVGIGLAGLDDEGIVDASNMVNGNGGSWGYVTVVIPENDRDFSKWQGICNKLRVARLIPIFRLATQPSGGSWRRPDKEGAGEWAGFLNRLNCTTETTYVVLFNEPNHAPEWGGGIDPVNYAETTLQFAKTLKSTSNKFFIMPAGLDQAAPHQPPNYYDAGQFWREVLAAQPSYFDYFDGLSAHCYPNPGFSASPHKRGRNSIDCYDWELSHLRSLGVNKELPVFITETGWVAGAGNLAENYKIAFEQVWLPDSRVRAVTPFILSYIGHPFEPFSFKKINGTPDRKYNDQYYAVHDLPKVQGNPPHKEKVNVLSPLPTTLIKGSTYHFQLWLRNAGQSIWHKPEGFVIDFINKPSGDYSFSSLYNVEPGDSTIINLHVTVKEDVGSKDLSIGLFKNGENKALLFPWNARVIDPPPMQVVLSAFPGTPYDGEATIQIFNAQNKLLFQNKKVNFENGIGMLPEISGVSLGQKYRIVALVDFYLPRQESFVVDNQNVVTFEMLIPGDSNHDGKFSIEDVFLLPKSRELFRSFLPGLIKSSLGKDSLKQEKVLVRRVMKK